MHQSHTGPSIVRVDVRGDAPKGLWQKLLLKVGLVLSMGGEWIGRQYPMPWSGTFESSCSRIARDRP
ncbi:hypothetical protein EMIT0P218_70052 [Pseudomonas sp. IT-P218]